MHMSNEVEFRNKPLGSGPFGGGVFTVAVSITDVLMRMQIRLGLRGDFAEIGVLEGIYIHQLYPYLNNDEVCYAIDPYFELPDLREKVRLDFQSRYGLKNQVQFLYESSLSLSPEKLIREGSPGIRFLSIDGDHSEKYVLNDLVLAQKILVDGGIVAVDDYFDPLSPGVSIGMTRYFLESNNERLAVLISGGNKVFLTTKGEYLSYRLLLEKFTNIRDIKTGTDSEWFGHSVFFTEKVLIDNL